MRHIIAAQKVRYNCSISYNFNGTKVQFYDPYESLNIEGLKLNSGPNLPGPMCFKTVKDTFEEEVVWIYVESDKFVVFFPPGSQR